MCSPDPAAAVDVVVKVGGALVADVEVLDRTLAATAAAAQACRLVIVPGGGPFADAVRRVDRRMGLPETAAHWMAVLAMDQYAHLIAARLSGAAVVVNDARAILEAIDAGRLPVLAPSRWLLDADPLPHSWDVTSDSIAAWIAGRLGARRLVLVKPPGVGATSDAVDPYFTRALPQGVEATIVAADRIDMLRSALYHGSAAL